MSHKAEAQTSSVAAEILAADDATFLDKFPGLKDAISKVPEFPTIEAEETEDIVALKAEITKEKEAEKKEEEEEEEVEVEGEEGEEVEEEKPEAKEDKEEKEEKKSEKKPQKLATDFQVFDADGELDAESFAGVKVKFKADGKVQELPLDRVVRLAQFGKYNERLVAEADTAKEKASEFEKTVEERDEMIEGLRQYARRLLEDDEFLGSQRTEFEKENTPEEQLKRERAEKQRLIEEKQRTKFETAAVEFVVGLDKKLASLQEKYAKHITDDEVRGRMDKLVLPLKRRGTIPQEKWSEVERIVEGELTNWMAALYDEREEKTATSGKKAAAEVEKAKEEVRAAKRSFARAVKPPAGGSLNATITSSSPAKRKAPSTQEQAERNILGDVLKLVQKG